MATAGAVCTFVGHWHSTPEVASLRWLTIEGRRDVMCPVLGLLSVATRVVKGLTLLKGHGIYPVERKTPSFRAGEISDLAGSLLLVNVVFEDADWCSPTRSCEVGRRPQSALPIPLHQIGPLLSEHSAGHAFQRVDERRHRDFRRVLDKQ